MPILAINSNFGSPATMIFVVFRTLASVNAFVSGYALMKWAAIPIVLIFGAFAKIVPLIVERYVVPVIDLLAGLGVHNYSMHSDIVSALCVKGFQIGIPSGVPLPLTQPFKVCIINNRYLPLREWYIFHGAKILAQEQP